MPPTCTKPGGRLVRVWLQVTPWPALFCDLLNGWFYRAFGGKILKGLNVNSHVWNAWDMKCMVNNQCLQHNPEWGWITSVIINSSYSTTFVVGIAMGYRNHGFHRMAIHIEARWACSIYCIATSLSCSMAISTTRLAVSNKCRVSQTPEGLYVYRNGMLCGTCDPGGVVLSHCSTFFY